MILETALFCLALNVYHEARGEIIPGQYAVALVTMNRAKGDPKKVCPTVFKAKQFSWTNDSFGMVQRIGTGFQLTTKGVPKESYAWSVAVIVAERTLYGQIKDFTEGATFYHAVHVEPAWSRVFTKTNLIGNHQFYVKR